MRNMTIKEFLARLSATPGMWVVHSDGCIREVDTRACPVVAIMGQRGDKYFGMNDNKTERVNKSPLSEEDADAIATAADGIIPTVDKARYLYLTNLRAKLLEAVRTSETLDVVEEDSLHRSRLDNVTRDVFAAEEWSLAVKEAA